MERCLDIGARYCFDMEQSFQIDWMIRHRRACVAWLMVAALVLAGLFATTGHANYAFNSTSNHTSSYHSFAAQTLEQPICNTAQQADVVVEMAAKSVAGDNSFAGEHNTPLETPATPDHSQRCLSGACTVAGALAANIQTADVSRIVQSGPAENHSNHADVQPRAIGFGNGFGSRAPPAF
jgi:hypothetical protein